MRQLMIVAAIFATVAPAQDISVFKKAALQPFGVMGKVVKGAPYSADEVTESLQVLADGTRISHQSQVTVYRDGEGRIRRESPTEITIFDPVANTNYRLDPKTMTATKMTMGYASYSFGPNQVQFYASTTVNGQTTTQTTPKLNAAADVEQAKVMLDKLQAEMTFQNGDLVVNGNPAVPGTAEKLKVELTEAQRKLGANMAEPAASESLGQQMIEGVMADGTRSTTTIEIGAIGNDRPIKVVSERWFSADLQTPVMSKRTDPRTGEETFKLTNVRRGEPGADLFMLPPGYQLATTKFAPVPARKEQ